MEITGKIIKLLEPQKFTSKKNGNEYVRHAFVIETQGDYPKKAMFTVMGDDRFRQMGIVVGKTYAVSFDVDCREWQGRWFNDLSAWKAVCLDGQHQQAQAPQQQQKPQEQIPQPNDDGGGSDNLPF